MDFKYILFFTNMQIDYRARNKINHIYLILFYLNNLALTTIVFFWEISKNETVLFK